jgi:putative transcriptional regulator
MSKAGKRIIEPLKEAVAFSRGELPEGSCRVHIFERVDVKAIREQTGLSQAAFANKFGLSVVTLRDWEQGAKPLDPTARAYLKVIEKAPDVVANALAPSLASTKKRADPGEQVRAPALI